MRSQRLKLKGEREARGQRSEVRYQRSEVRGQESGVGGKKAVGRRHLSWYLDTRGEDF